MIAGLGFMIISTQTMKAAVSNPVDSPSPWFVSTRTMTC